MDLSSIVEKLGRLGRDHGQKQDEGASAAVAAIFREDEGAAEIFFIRRAERAGDPWSGHVAFPGGRREPADGSLLETAMRETREEVGIALEESELVARLPDLPAFQRSKNGTMVVSPFVFVVKRPLVIAPQEAEVASTMWIPFERLVRGEGRGTFIWPWEGKTLELPCFHLGGAPVGGAPFEAAAIAAGQPILWGMTYRMLETLFEALLPVQEQI